MEIFQFLILITGSLQTEDCDMKLYLFSFVLLATFGCSGVKKNNIKTPKRQISALEELEINEISDSEFSNRASVFKGNPDAEIDELDDFDRIVTESVGELSIRELSDLGHVSEPLTQAVIFCHQRKSKSGLKILNSLYSKYSKTPRYWNIKGICYLKNHELKKAKYFFDYALGINEKYGPAINNLAVLYFLAGNHQKSYMLLEFAKSKTRLNSAKFNYAFLSFKKGFFNKSAQVLESLLRDNKNNKKILSLLAANYVRLKKLNEAREVFKLIGSLENIFDKMNYALMEALDGNKESGLKLLKSLEVGKSTNLNLLNHMKQYILGLK